jgi:hypothetical protein
MRVLNGLLAAVAVMCMVSLIGAFSMRTAGAASGAADTTAGSPVLVELFTSEGCSSCPPADELLAQIGQKIPNAIVLSEHVTYWNNGGWHDPFSSDDSTERQADYVAKLGVGDGSYTPQMIVDGRYQFVGNDARAASQAIARAAQDPEVPVRIADVKAGEDRRVSFAIETDTVKSNAQLFVVVAQDEGTRHVSTGENGGRTLRHVMIARSFLNAAKIKGGGSYSGRLTVKLPDAVQGSGWHLVAFVEQGRGGPVLGAASAAVQSDNSSSTARAE